MAKNSQIEWTHHTFNPWWGCKKVSAACDNCYAELWAKRMGHQLWGIDAPRRFFSDAHWNEPRKWNEEAKRRGRRERVFCASMADVFERRADLNPERERLWRLIETTPSLDWLLLTKRPQNVQRFAPWRAEWPTNVWIGTSVENQTIAEKRLPFLLNLPAAVRFVSCEPLLGPLNLRRWFKHKSLYPIDWVIAGGESGSGARPMHPEWPTDLLKQCLLFDVPFHFKQWGQWAPVTHMKAQMSVPARIDDQEPFQMVRMSKKLTGRVLEGSIWDGLPHIALVHA